MKEKNKFPICDVDIKKVKADLHNTREFEYENRYPTLIIGLIDYKLNKMF